MSQEKVVPDSLIHRIQKEGRPSLFNAGLGKEVWGGLLGEDVIWNGSQFVVVGSYGSIRTSPDGITWTVRDDFSISETISAISWNGSLFVVVGTQGLVRTSPDGVTWTTRGSAISKWLTSIVWDGSKFVAVGIGGNILTNSQL